MDCAFPDRCRSPAQGNELLFYTYVAKLIARQFAPPVIGVSRGQFGKLTLMPMPETAVHKKDDLPSRHDDVGFTRQALRVQRVAEASGVQSLPDNDFRFGVLRANAGHYPAPSSLIDDIAHLKLLHLGVIIDPAL